MRSEVSLQRRKPWPQHSCPLPTPHPAEHQVRSFLPAAKSLAPALSGCTHEPASGHVPLLPALHPPSAYTESSRSWKARAHVLCPHSAESPHFLPSPFLPPSLLCQTCHTLCHLRLLTATPLSRPGEAVPTLRLPHSHSLSHQPARSFLALSSFACGLCPSWSVACSRPRTTPVPFTAQSPVSAVWQAPQSHLCLSEPPSFIKSAVYDVSCPLSE